MCYIGLLLAVLPALALASQPVVTDSRIKTFVYNENDVYSMLTHYGYQSNIEFGPKEEIYTISVGDRVGWQIVPAGQRLFIRALGENLHTNMTVVTNKHAYQFDLHSSGAGPLRPDEALAYVVRFYYPNEEGAPKVTPVTSQQITGAAAPQAPAAPAPPRYNYQYTYTGPDQLAPLKVFDDGAATYFRLSTPVGKPMPQVFVVGPDGKEIPAQVMNAEGGFTRVNTLAARFVVRYGEEFICIYNERM